MSQEHQTAQGKPLSATGMVIPGVVISSGMATAALAAIAVTGTAGHGTSVVIAGAVAGGMANLFLICRKRQSLIPEHRNHPYYRARFKVGLTSIVGICILLIFFIQAAQEMGLAN